MKLSLIFPAYNEAAAIIGVLEDWIQYAQTHRLSYECIVVNDGSSDTTGEQVQQFSLQHPEVRLIEHATNQGYGAALRSGFLAARGDYIFFTDGDGQFQPDDLDRTLPLLDPHTIILGYRAPRAEGLWRRVCAWLWGRWIRFFFGLRVRDLNCAWKLFPRTLVINNKFISNGAFISAELLYRAQQQNFMFQEIPVRHLARQSGSPTGVNLRVVWRAWREFMLFRSAK